MMTFPVLYLVTPGYGAVVAWSYNRDCVTELT